jgi:hypothetical protein
VTDSRFDSVWRSDARRVCAAMLTFACVSAAGGCTINYKPAFWERSWVESGKRAMVLIRLTARGEDQHVVAGVKVLSLWVADFDSGGEPKPIESTIGRGFDGSSARDGWYYMLLKPGTHYFYAGGFPRPGEGLFEDGVKANALGQVRRVRTRIDVPVRGGVVYAGSLHVPVRTRRLIIGRECIGIDDAGVTISDESDAAAAIIRTRARWAGIPQKALMERHRGETLQFRTASADPWP